jgi:hypothetical protein
MMYEDRAAEIERVQTLLNIYGDAVGILGRLNVLGVGRPRYQRPIKEVESVVTLVGERLT